jgi:hypothetical protein
MMLRAMAEPTARFHVRLQRIRELTDAFLKAAADGSSDARNLSHELSAELEAIRRLIRTKDEDEFPPER